MDDSSQFHRAIAPGFDKPCFNNSEKLVVNLWWAVDKGDSDKVRSLLQQGADPNHDFFWSTGLMYPPLHKACGKGHLPIVKTIVKYKADINKGGGEHNQTPLHWACSAGNLDIVLYLVDEAKCKVELRDLNGQSPLDIVLDYLNSSEVFADIAYCLIKRGCGDDHQKGVVLCKASLLGKINIVKELVDQYKINPNDVRDDEGRSPLDMALFHRTGFGNKNCIDVALYLIKCGCGNDGHKAKLLCRASGQVVGRLDVVKELIEQCGASPGAFPGHLVNKSIGLYRKEDIGDIKELAMTCFSAYTAGWIVTYADMIDVWGKSAVDRALNNGITDIAVYLIKQGGGNDDQRGQVLIWACLGDHLELVKELVEKHKINPHHIQTKSVRDMPTALHTACLNGNRDIIAYLMEEQNCSANFTEDKHGRTPFYLACEEGTKDTVLYLIEQEKCTVDMLDKNGKTPLHFACKGGKKDTVIYLIEQKDCTVDVRDKSGKSPLDTAIENAEMCYPDCVTGKDCVDVALYLINCGYGDEYDRAKLLCGACYQGKLDAVKELFEQHQVKPSNVRNKDNKTPFQLACEGGDQQTLAYLIEEHNYSVDMRSKKNRVPLHWACKAGNIDAVVYLIEEQHCSIDVTDSKGKTPLDLATERGMDIVIEYLKSLSSTQHCLLNEDEKEVLHKLLLSNKIKISLGNHVTLKFIQQQLRDNGHDELAMNLKAKLDEVLQKQQEHAKQLDKLMVDDDIINQYYLRLMLVGPPFVGKTTTLSRLLKVFENIETAGDKAQKGSTLLANCTQVLVFISDEAAEWLASDTVDEEAKILYKYLCGVEEQRTANEAELTGREPTTEDVVNQDEVSQTAATSTKAKETPEKASYFEQQVTSSRRQKVATSTKLEFIKARLQKVIKNGDYSKMAALLEKGIFLNISDIGGQPGFLEMLPALLKGPAMYLVFFDLSKDLGKPYKIPFSRNDTVITPYDSMHTVESTVSQILASVSSMHAHHLSTSLNTVAFDEKFRKVQQIPPLAALIGTHLDKVEDPKEEKVRETSQALEKTTSRFSNILISSGPKKSRTFLFPVNNQHGTEEKEVAPLREFMTKTFRTHFKDAALPIRKRWLIFGIILRKEYLIATIEECYEIGEMLEMGKEEVDICLWYHSECVGTLLIYRDIPDDDGWFRTHVICRPQVIFDSISQLILASLRTLHSEGPLLEYDRKEWIKKGQFSAESIEKYCGSVDENNIIPVKQLNKLLKHVNLLSPIIHCDNVSDITRVPQAQVTYLFPAILECASYDELSKCPLPDANNPEPVHIIFKSGFVPTGVFCGLVTRLVSEGPKKILGLTWKLVEDKVKRNCFSFCVDDVNKVTLVSHERSYEIRILRQDYDISLHDLCTNVLSTILYILKSLYEHLAPKIAFQCPCSKHSRSIDDLCVLSHGSKVRFVCCETLVSLKAEHYVWLGKLVACNCGIRANLAVLKFASRQALEFFSFHWSKVGAEYSQPPADPNKPNVISFESMSEDDLGYYMCEVKEAEKVVLTVYRAFYKDILSEEISSSKGCGAVCHSTAMRMDHCIDRDSTILPSPKRQKLDSYTHPVDGPMIGKHYPDSKQPEPPTKRPKLDNPGDCQHGSLQYTQFDDRLKCSDVGIVFEKVFAACVKWTNIGLKLDVAPDTLAAINERCREDPDKCLREMLIHRLSAGSPLTWSGLCDCLRSCTVARNDIAEEIEQWVNRAGDPDVPVSELADRLSQL